MSQQSDQGVTPSGSGCQPSASAADVSSRSGIPNAIADKLDEARALIERPGAWTKGWFARNDKGNKVSSHPTGRTAICFCAAGAIVRATGCTEVSLLLSREYRALQRVVGHDVPEWNDAPERTQAEVIEAFRKAAELARQEQAA